MSGFKPPSSLPTVFDPSYKGIGEKVGLEIWRVEKLAVVKKPPTDECYAGKLYSGDSYIVLQTRLRENALEHHIFFWLGKETSQDEMGVAAYKTVEMDQSMGGEPVQHREVQGHETDQFLSLFPKGVQYLEGGIATGFKHVDREAFKTRLLHVKGRRNPRVQEVEISSKSMNEGDVFILDAGRDIVQWNGSKASNVEKQKALEITRAIRDQERGGNASIHIIESGRDKDDIFWSKAGITKGKVASAEEGGDDDAHTRKAAEAIKLWHLSDASGSLKLDEVKDRPLKKELLSTNDSYILDVGNALYAWVGRNASEQEKLHAMKYAVDFITKNKLPISTPVTRVVEDGETPIFKGFFQNWPEKDAAARGGTGPGTAGKKKFVPKGFDAKSMHTPAEREKARLPDDGSGKLKIWRIENMEKADLPADQYGQFYSGDSYVLLYTYLVNGVEKYIIYFWQGLKSSQDEKAASAVWATKMDDELKGAAVQCRVVQNKEPPHFYVMFKGKMVIHEGGKASGFKNIGAKDSYDTDGTRLYHVRGTNESNTRAIQVPEKASSLNSGDTFVLETPKNVWLWFGKGCSGDEREFCKAISKKISGREYTILTEGSEPADFWAALGGKTEYASSKAATEPAREPRLFQCSNAKGYFYVEEVFDFDQEDLIEDDVMILDTYYEVFVWIGNGANTVEKKGALETAIEYVRTDTSGRKVDDTVFLQIKQGFEPPNFTAHFHAWDPAKWSSGKSYAELCAELKASNPTGGAATAASPVSVASALSQFSPTKTYSLKDLTAKDLPEGVDASHKELYLTDDEFKAVFKMTKAEYKALPEWKAKNAKKAAKMF